MRLGIAAFAAFAVCAVLVGGIAGPGAAYADRDDKPWEHGVSAEKQKRALKIFQAGNELFEQSKYTDAVVQYEKALAAWDHPKIRFNLALCLVHMRQPMPAWEHMKQALRFGDAPLGAKLYADAMTYMALLEQSLAQITVSSEQPDVRVMLDGKELFTGPHAVTLRVLAGPHQLVATRDGYTTDTRALALPAGEKTAVAIELLPVEVKVVNERVNYERRWSWWLPWTVLGGGIALGVAGTGAYLWGNSTMRDYDEALAVACPVGCRPDEIPPDLAAAKDRAERRNAVGVGLLITGGVVAITAGVMAVMNRPRPTEERGVTPTVTWSPDFVGGGLSFAFE
jgi:hypothetical protein